MLISHFTPEKTRGFLGLSGFLRSFGGRSRFVGELGTSNDLNARLQLGWSLGVHSCSDWGISVVLKCFTHNKQIVTALRFLPWMTRTNQEVLLFTFHVHII